VVMYFKNKFNRVRPGSWSPGLSPPIPYPGHPAYRVDTRPRCTSMAMTAAYLVPSAEAALMERAWDVAVNPREGRAATTGATRGGRALAHQVFAILTSDCAMFKADPQEGKDTEWLSPSSGRVSRNSNARACARRKEDTMTGSPRAQGREQAQHRHGDRTGTR